MGRGSRFSTILNWFREADSNEVRAIMPLVLEAVGQRKILIGGPLPSYAPPTKRHRRTKAELLASRLNASETAAAAGA
jgi:hypothetical protein